MNKRNILASLNNLANEFDNLGKFEYANKLTNIMIKLSMDNVDLKGMFCPECGENAEECDCGYIEERKDVNLEDSGIDQEP